MEHAAVIEANAAALQADSPPIAAVIDDGSCNVDALLEACAERQRAAGTAVQGLVMTFPTPGTGCARAMVLLDIATREPYLVSQPLGAGSAACRADPQGFARASAVLRRAAQQPPELVIVNRFGGLEAEGGGFRAELLELMALGVPLLTSVATRHIDAWRAFTGDAALLLPATPAAVDGWLGAVLGSETTHDARH